MCFCTCTSTITGVNRPFFWGYTSDFVCMNVFRCMKSDSDIRLKLMIFGRILTKLHRYRSSLFCIILALSW